MSELPVVCIITSSACGHCNRMRNGGDFVQGACIPTIPGGYCWNEPFFKTLICGENSNKAQTRVYEIHFATLSFNLSDMFDKIVEFNEFLWTGSNIQRNKYRSEYIKVPEAKNDKNPDGDLRVVSINGDKITTGLLSFKQFLINNIPSQIYPYIPHYPSWVFISGKDWNTSLQTNSPMLASVAGCNTIKETNGEYKVIPNNNNKTDSILIYSSQLMDGKIPSITSIVSPEISRESDSIEEECLKRGYVKSSNMIMMKTGDVCVNLGYQIKSGNK